MNENTDAQKVFDLLSQYGIKPRQHAKTVASILGLKYVTVKQKLNGDRGFSAEQIKKIEEHFKNEVTSNWNAITYISSIPTRCHAEIGEKITAPFAVPIVARKENNIWYITSSKDTLECLEYYKVNRIDTRPAPKVVVLDNDISLVKFATMFLANNGMDVSGFTEPAKLNEQLDKNEDFECFILDWVLDDRKTSKEIIEKIRVENKNVPIFILTGELSNDKTIDNEISEMVSKYNTIVLEKPIKPKIITAQLWNILFRQSTNF
ncbi:hypothetical protein BUE93_20285 [Chromobacterium amazonense]|uniref:Response regulatory domain-containing protein n=1 Tax=Chromobacterium amazonense TaxID=1382803 RepID=A0A2S9WZ98_9NEIS|nr:helix-turn-helix domain-containing protein [Chromobacterium amazonense]PRP68790.1 hypothetical protein BUE93_20285 [Chromobacterium amazonense]